MLWPWAFSFGLNRDFVECNLRRMQVDVRTRIDLHREKIGADRGLLPFMMTTASKV
jgi:hypothetical protein